MFLESKVFKALNLGKISGKLQTASSLGRKYKRNLTPYLPKDKKELAEEYRRLQKLMLLMSRVPHNIENIKQLLSHFEDIGLILTKCSQGEILEIYELCEIKSFLYYHQALSKEMELCGGDKIFPLESLFDVFLLLDADGKQSPAFHLHSSYSVCWAEIEAAVKNFEQEKKHILQKTLQTATESNPNFMEEVAVSRLNKELLHLYETSPFYEKKAENFANITFGLKLPAHYYELENLLQTLKNQATAEEEKIREALSAKLRDSLPLLEQELTACAHLDWLIAKGEFGLKYHGVIPNLSDCSKICSEQAVNLPVKEELEHLGIAYQPVDLCFSAKTNVLTGANMGGKTSILKTVGQFAWLLAYALPLPAKKVEMRLYDFVFVSGVFEERRRMDLSNFGLEVVAISEALSKEGSGLFLLDEFASGTNPEEGEAFFNAVLETFAEADGQMLAATHFRIRTKEAEHFRIKGIEAKNLPSSSVELPLKERLSLLHSYMNYSLEPVQDAKSVPKQALLIAGLLGAAEKIIAMAKKYLEQGKSF